MLQHTVSIPSNAGALTLDLTAIYADAKTAFLAEYADDPAVNSAIMRNGDLAEREYLDTVKQLSPERCSAVSPDQIRDAVAGQARFALVTVALGTGKRSRRKVAR